MKEVVIVSALRSAMGTFGGSFKDVSAVDLGAKVLQESYERLNLDPTEFDEVILGNVLSAGLGQNVARQVAMNAGIPKEVPAFTINQVCGDRKSTRLNSSHVSISYAVFCLKKKKQYTLKNII